MSRFLSAGLLAIVSVIGPATSAEPRGDTPSAAGDTTSSPEPTPRRAGWSVAPFPVLFSTPETGFGGGAGAVLTHRSRGDTPRTRPQALGIVAFYTAKNQSLFGLAPDLHFRRDSWRLRAEGGYRKFPTSFYGKGNDTPDTAEEDYTIEGAGLEATLTKRVYAELRLGALYGIKRPRYTKTEPGGLLDRGGLVGHEGGLLTGVGPYAEWDTRDESFYPSTGSLLTALARTHGAWCGSDFAYDVYAFDLRRYVAIRRSHVVALQFVGTHRTGDVPFDDLARLGDVLRGIYAGRFLDRALLATQAEYRFPVGWRFSGAVFLGAGDVAGGWRAFRLAGTKVAGGAGLRFAIDRIEKINIRLDYATSGSGEEMYIELMEAF